MDAPSNGGARGKITFVAACSYVKQRLSEPKLRRGSEGHGDEGHRDNPDDSSSVPKTRNSFIFFLRRNEPCESLGLGEHERSGGDIMKMRIWLPVAAILFLSACGSKPAEKGTDLSKANTTYQNELMELLMDAKPGAEIEIPAGVFAIDTELSLVVDGVTIRGQGMDKTILN